MNNSNKDTVLFVISTPFQALCAVEAMKEFEVKYYKVVVIVFKNNPRINQTRSVLDKYNVNYDIKIITALSFFPMYLKALLCRKSVYSKVFVGDIFMNSLLAYSLKSMKKGCEIIYLDDGNSTINAFTGRVSLAPTIYASIKNWSIELFLKHIIKTKTTSFFTLYSDLAPEDIIVYRNTLRNVLLNRKPSNDKTHYLIIVGTYFELDDEEGRNRVLCILKEMKSCYKSVIYIPHGRDRDPIIKKYCVDIGIKYINVDTCIEQFIVESGYNNFDVCGFFSSALFSIKIMFPESKVFNFVFPDKIPQDYVMIEPYYSKHGIISISTNKLRENWQKRVELV